MLSNYGKREIARMHTQAKFPFLIEVTHDQLGTLYYANSDDDIIYNGNTYHGSVFSIDPPDKEGSRIGDASITISAVDQIWIERIRNTQKPAKLKFMATIIYENGQYAGIEEIEQYEFTLRGVSWDDVSITWNLVFDDRMARICPPDRASSTKCPGCA